MEREPYSGPVMQLGGGGGSGETQNNEDTEEMVRRGEILETILKH